MVQCKALLFRVFSSKCVTPISHSFTFHQSSTAQKPTCQLCTDPTANTLVKMQSLRYYICDQHRHFPTAHNQVADDWTSLPCWFLWKLSLPIIDLFYCSSLIYLSCFVTSVIYPSISLSSFYWHWHSSLLADTETFIGWVCRFPKVGRPTGTSKRINVCFIPQCIFTTWRKSNLDIVHATTGRYWWQLSGKTFMRRAVRTSNSLCQEIRREQWGKEKERKRFRRKGKSWEGKDEARMENSWHFFDKAFCSWEYVSPSLPLFLHSTHHFLWLSCFLCQSIFYSCRFRAMTPPPPPLWMTDEDENGCWGWRKSEKREGGVGGCKVEWWGDIKGREMAKEKRWRQCSK